MQFEGSEKKAEVYVDNSHCHLLVDFDHQYWQKLVTQAGAKILSVKKNNECHAYLLSESSLFVWHDHFIILTCGVTNLARAIEFFIESVTEKSILSINYQRKNEYFSHQQPSCFKRDIAILQRHVNGETYLLGQSEQHHNQVFQYIPRHNNNIAMVQTYELLAYQISDTASKFFTSNGVTTTDIVQYLRLDQLLNGFTVDDFMFSPYGYSLNAIHHHDYLTIHITPQPHSSYVSIVASINLLPLIPRILATLAPKSFDIVTVNDKVSSTEVSDYMAATYHCKNHSTALLKSGHSMDYHNFTQV